MEEKGSGAAGGGLPLEERRDLAAYPACADASRAGAGSGRASPGRNIPSRHHPSPHGLRPDGPRTAEVEETYMVCRRNLRSLRNDALARRGFNR